MLHEFSSENQSNINECIKNYKPFLIRNALSIRVASQKWSPEYIASINKSLKIPTKQYGKEHSIGVSSLELGHYLDYLKLERTKGHEPSKEEILYCHDIPMFNLMRELVPDIQLDFLNIIPKWYHYKWWRYVQFFMGPKGSWTPLHFDCLLTHNIFFHVYGKKKFILIQHKDMKHCGRVGWRWFSLDPEKPDINKFPDFTKLQITEVILNSGDILYMPPGTLHAVRGLEESISFNIDFHTPKSSINGVIKLFQGMPLQNAYYNFISLLGVVFKVPAKYLFPLYKSYLNYVS
jgi:hypothetical protein